MSTALAVCAVWCAVAVPAGLFIGRAIRVVTRVDDVSSWR